MQALLALTTRPGEEAETVAYLVEVTPGFGDAGVGARGSRNDRGAALLIASDLENSLRIAIEGRGSIVSSTGLQASQEIAIIQSEVHLGNTGSNWYR